jgi:hypothetical protein
MTQGPKDQDIDETYPQDTYVNSSILLTKMRDGTLEIVNEVNLDYGRKVKMEFSPCGRFLIMYYVKNKVGSLTVWNIEDSDIEGCVSQIAEYHAGDSEI